MKGSITELRAYMKKIGATIGKNGASTSMIESLQNMAKQMGRSVDTNNASIIGSAIINGAKIITNDKRMINYMNAIGLPVTTY